MPTPPSRSTTLGLFILRAIVGVVFVVHGGQKLFVFGLPRVHQQMAHLGVPLPAAAAVLVTMLEFVGGLLMLIGLFVRPVAALIAIEMLVAMLLVHWSRGFFNPGIEYPLVLLCVNAALVMVGGGAWSIDGWVAGGRRAHDRESARIRP